MYLTNQDRVYAFFLTLARVKKLVATQELQKIDAYKVIMSEAEPLQEFKDALDEVYPKIEVPAAEVPIALVHRQIFKEQTVGVPVDAEFHEVEPAPKLEATGWVEIPEAPKAATSEAEIEGIPF